MSKAAQATVSGIVLGCGLGLSIAGLLIESGLVGTASRPLVLIGFVVMMLTFPLQVLFRKQKVERPTRDGGA